jgi:hypothetical protein
MNMILNGTLQRNNIFDENEQAFVTQIYPGSRFCNSAKTKNAF